MLRRSEPADVKELCKAAAFVLTTRDRTTTGVGVLCVDCRYAGVFWPGAEIDRRLGTPTDWPAIDRELKAGLTTATLSPLTACAQVLAGSTGATVQWVGWAKRMEVDDPSQTPAMLDALLYEAGELLWAKPQAKKAPLESRLTCPACGVVTVEMMPVHYCQRFYDCPACGTVITTTPGSCCVYCSYGDTPCPPKQAGLCCDAPKG